MAETKPILERIYVVPLRRQFLLLPRYRRAGRAAKALKQFIAKHMKVIDRNVNNVKLDMYLNNELWFRGRRNPPSKIKVKAVKEGDIVRVELAEMPQIVQFAKAKHTKRHQESEKKAEAKPAEAAKPAETAEEKAEKAEEKKEEKEKEKSVEQEKLKEAKQDKTAQKHTAKGKAPEIHRRAMSRH